MTSFAFILGVVPLVISSGAGAEMRQALGTAVFFGMLGVTASASSSRRCFMSSLCGSRSAGTNAARRSLHHRPRR